MNYAALLALLAVLAFTLPFLVRIAENAGLPRGYSILTTLASAIVVLAWVLLRGHMRKQALLRERVEHIYRQLRDSPQTPQSYYYADDHLGDLLLSLGNTQEALEVFRNYLQLLETQGSDLEGHREAREKVRKAVQRLQRDVLQP